MAIPYASLAGKLLNKEIDYDTDDIRATLHTATYSVDRLTHDYVNDLTNELATANGYTVGGVALSSKQIVTTAANSWGTQWAASTAVAVDRVVRPTTGNGFLYRAAVAGTTAAGAPTWPTTVGATVTDGGVTWVNEGRSITVLSCGTISWTLTSGATGIRYLVISDRTPGTAATQPLLAYVDFVTDRTGTGGTFEVVPDSQGIIHVFS